MVGILHTYKARLIEKGYTQLYGVDYKETFSPVANIRAIRILISIASYYDYEIWQIDVKTAFSNGYLDEDIYMVQPEGLVDPNHPRKVCKLQRFIYGLKQASRSWNKRLDEEIKRNTKDMFLVYGGNPEGELRVDCYCDAGFETDRDDTKSQTGYVFILNGGAVDWKSSKQSTTAMSATEAEYIAASEAAIEAVWIRKFILGLGIVPTIKEPIRMFCDNSAALHFANEPGVQKGARHYHRRYHYVRESIALGKIRFLKVHTDDNLADPFTKALPKGKLTQHARSMGLHLKSQHLPPNLPPNLHPNLAPDDLAPSIAPDLSPIANQGLSFHRFKYDSTGSHAINLPEDHASKKGQRSLGGAQARVSWRCQKVIENTKDLKTLGIQELLSSLKSYEQRMTRHSGKAIESAFQASLQGDKRSQQNFGKGSSSRGGRGGRNFRAVDVDKVTAEVETITKKKIVGIKESITTVEKSDTWFLDSGCSNHMTGDQSILVNIDTAGNSQVKKGNGAVVQVKGKGKIPVKTKTDIKYINDVLLVPNITQNLLSVGQLVKHEYRVIFEGKCCNIYNKGRNRELMQKIIMGLNRSFLITFRYEEHTALKAITEDEALLWHRRLGYLNFQSLNLLHQKILVGGLPQIHEIKGVCEGCALEKHHRKPFPKGVAWRAKEILKLVHTEFCGPMRNPSHGKEYNSKEFDKFYEYENMHGQLTTRYTPQQNGIVERKNQIVVEMAKSIMQENGLPQSFWAAAVYSEIYLLNQSPIKALDNKTPLEAWNGRKPSEEEKKEGTSFPTNNLQDEAHVEQPESFEEVVREESWKKAMEDEIQVIKKNNTWELTDRPSDKDVIGVKWVHKVKFNADGSVQRNKARLVAKGYSQQPGIDYDKTFSPVARMDTVRAIISLAGQKGWLLYQLDVKSAFLNGELNEEVYVNQPQGFKVEGKEEKVYKLKKALYGLKQAHRAWYSQINGYFKEKGFDQIKSESTLYVKNQGTSDILIVVLYVDDLVFTGNNKNMIEDFKNEMMQKYEMSDLGLLNHFLGMEIYQDEGGVFICQEKYVEKILKIFDMSKCKPNDTPLVVNDKLMIEDGSSKVDATLYRSLVGKLLYLTTTRPDIMFAASLLSRFMHNPSQIHMGQSIRFVPVAGVEGGGTSVGLSAQDGGPAGYQGALLVMRPYLLVAARDAHGVKARVGGGTNIHSGVDSSRAPYVATGGISTRDVCGQASSGGRLRERVVTGRGPRKVDAGTVLALTSGAAGAALFRRVGWPVAGAGGRARSRTRRAHVRKHLAIIACQLGRSGWEGDRRTACEKILVASGTGGCIGVGLLSGKASPGHRRVAWKGRGRGRTAFERVITRAEYIAAALATSQVIWLRRFFEDIGEKQSKPTTIFCDSMSAIAIAKNPVHHSRTKHIALKHYFIREEIEDGEVQLEFCGTNDQLADIFTKALPREKFQELRRNLGVQPKHITGRM
ncbi:retrovirus-related pol polyprotein from transposon TNT 1-94 [Tanacetum coccineum]